jgi:hypothetical protein
MSDGRLTRVQPFAGSDMRGMTVGPSGEAVIVSSASGDITRWELDTVDPELAIEPWPSPVTEDPSPTFQFASNEPESQFTCSWDGVAFTACSSPATYEGSLAEGHHTFQVRATDPDGRTGTSGSRSFTVSDGPPETTILTGPGSGSVLAGSSTTFTFSADEAGATFECSLDDAAFSVCQSPHVLNGLAPGEHTLRVRARDTIGNLDPTPASRAFEVEAQQPPADKACKKAKAQLARAKAKLKRAKASGKEARIKKAKANVKQARKKVKKAC